MNATNPQQHNDDASLDIVEPTPPRKALLALILTIPAPSIGVLAAMYLWPDTSIGKTIFFACKFWMCAFPLAWHLLVDKHRRSLSPARKGGFGVGIALGLAIFGLIHLCYWTFGHTFVDADHVRKMAEENGMGVKSVYIFLCCYWIFVNSVLEEYVYRWFIFRKAESIVATRAAIVLSALAFTVHHILALAVQFGIVITVLGTIGVFAGGIIWSWTYGKYRSIWPGWVSHAIVDVAIFTIGWTIIFP